MLDMAILGFLREGPMHGYELKQRLVDLGFWRISFGSVYPALRRLEKASLIEVSPGSGRRKEYMITAEGKGFEWRSPVSATAPSLIQGVTYYADADPGSTVPGLMHVDLGGYHVRDIEFVAAFDVDDAKKVRT
jgi:hypothetical protein